MTTLTDEEAAARIRELHRGEWLLTNPTEMLCVECGHQWPCRTALWLQNHADEQQPEVLPVVATSGAKAVPTLGRVGEDPFTHPSEVPGTETPASRSLPSVNPPLTDTPLRPDTETTSGHEPQPQEQITRALDIIQDHRRVRNVRGCTGCDWKADRPGYASDPVDTLRRHQQFNEHLARLIVDAVT